MLITDNHFMLKWLDDNDILMYSTYNKGKSVVTERFIRTLKSKIYKRMRANDRKSHLDYLNTLVDESILLEKKSFYWNNLLMLIILL